MRRPLDQLWKERARAFRSETVPYWRYMSQSGFPGFVVLLLIVGMTGYGMLLRDLPPSFPVISAGTAALTPLVCWSPLRTWLHQADTVFLMPREGEMVDYLKSSWQYSVIPGMLILGAGFALYWPLYAQAAVQPKLWYVLVPLLAAMKALNAAGAWKERRFAWPGARRLVRATRWCTTALVLAAFLGSPLWKAGAFAALLVALYGVLVRLPLRHRFPWERLIAEEERSRRRYYRFFSSFIDVPELPSRTARRGYLSWIAGMVGYSHDHTYRYLFIHTLIRTELGGILIRLALLGVLAVYLASEAALFSGWGAALVYLLFMLLIGVQSGSLRQVHRHSVWRHIYPLPDEKRHGSLVRIVTAACAICGALLWLPLGLPLLLSANAVPAFAALAVFVIYILLVLPNRLQRCLKSELED